MVMELIRVTSPTGGFYVVVWLALPGDDRETRRTVIPTPRRDGGIFPGWGVRF